MDDNQRKERVDRARKAELQKIELCVQDVSDVEIDTRILNKISRKVRRSR